MGYTRANGKITFAYDNNQLVKDFLETGNDIVPIATGEDGESLLYERSRLFPFVDDGDEVSGEMMKRLWKSAYSDAVDELHRLVPLRWDAESVELSSAASSSLTMSIKDSSRYLGSDIDALDGFLRERLVLGALSAWFRIAEGAGADALLQRINGDVELLRNSSAPVIRRMTQALNRRTLRNPFSIH